MNDKKNVSAPVTGGASLLAIFAVLCLTVFAVLSLATLQADRRLFDSLEDSALSFYAADTEAQRILGLLREGEQDDIVELVQETDQYQEYHYQVFLSQDQALDCMVRIYQGGTYDILRWVPVRTVEWTGNYDTPVFAE